MANEQLGQLLSTYRTDARVSRLVKHAASEKPVRVHVDSTVGSQRAFVIAAMFQEVEAPIIAIADDKLGGQENL